MEKGSQPNPVNGMEGTGEQLGLHVPALRDGASVWQGLQHLTPVTGTYALRSATDNLAARQAGGVLVVGFLLAV